MTGPAWLAGILAALMAAVAVGSAARLASSRRLGRPAEADADALHAVMGVAMAGMLQPRLLPVPAAAWAAVFAAAGAWFTWRALRAGHRASRVYCPHPAPHAAECAAMVYMLRPVGSWPAGRGTGMVMPGMSQGATAGNPALTVLLALFMLGYALWVIDRLAALARSGAAAPALALAAQPALTADTARQAGSIPRAASPAPALATAVIAPRFAACSKIVMALTMGYMLVMML